MENNSCDHSTKFATSKLKSFTISFSESLNSSKVDWTVMEESIQNENQWSPMSQTRQFITPQELHAAKTYGLVGNITELQGVGKGVRGASHAGHLDTCFNLNVLRIMSVTFTRSPSGIANRKWSAIGVQCCTMPILSRQNQIYSLC